MAAGNWGWAGFNFPFPPWNFPGNMANNSFMADPRLNRGPAMAPPGFPSYNESYFHSNVQFAENPKRQGNASQAKPVDLTATTGKVLNYPKQKKKKWSKKKSSIPQEIPRKEAEAQNPQQPNPPGVSQPANVQGTQQRPPGTQNRDVKKRKAAGEAADADVPTQPYQKFKKELSTFPVQRLHVNSNEWRGDTSTMFSCSLCQYHTADEDQIQKHFYSYQHKEVLQHLYMFYPKERVDFLHDYLLFKKKNMSMELKNRNPEPPINALQGVNMIHCIESVQAVLCEACGVIIPDVPEALTVHIKSAPHKRNRKGEFRSIKDKSPAAAKKLLEDDDILQMQKEYDKGQNSFEAGSSPQEEDHTNNEDVIAGVRDEEVSVNHNEGPYHKNEDSGNKRFQLDDPEMMEPVDMTKETSSKTVEEESEEAAEAP